jgi:hypothetical protein
MLFIVYTAGSSLCAAAVVVKRLWSLAQPAEEDVIPNDPFLFFLY